MPKKITMKALADEVIGQHWYYEQYENASAAWKGLGADERANVLLLDIAASLRVLRCSNFTDIPRRLDRTRAAVEGLRRETKARARAHRRKL